MLRFSLCILFLFAFAPNSISAAHLVGGQLAYEHLGGNDYQIVLQLYRDCNCTNCADIDPTSFLTVLNPDGDFLLIDGSMPLFIFDGFVSITNPTIINPAPADNACFETIPDICLEEGTYKATITLPSEAGIYQVIYQRCCRNNTIDNIVNPGGTGSTMVVDIPHNVNAANNSSPVFLFYPPEIICAGSPLVYDHSASDLDGDSLVYSLYTPYTGASDVLPQPTQAGGYTDVTWLPGFSVDNMLGGASNLSIDPQSGILTAFPEDLGQFVVGIAVTEYRDGVALSVNRRDFQFNVTDCVSLNLTTGGEAIPISEDEYEIYNCFNYIISTADTDLGNITGDIFWDFGDPNSDFDTFSVLNAFHIYSDTGTYTITATGTSDIDGCDDVLTIYAQVYPISEVDFEVTGACSDGFEVQFTDVTGESNIVGWEWDFGDDFSDPLDNVSDLQNPSHTYTQGGTYQVSLQIVSDLGCGGTKEYEVVVADEFLAEAGNDIGTCAGEFVELDGSFVGGDGSAVSYQWTPANLVLDATVENPMVAPNVDTWFYLTVTNETGCIHTDSVLVQTLTSSSVELPDDTFEHCEGALTSITPSSSDDGIVFEWTGGGISNTDDWEITADFPETGYYVLSVGGGDCGDKDSVFIEVIPNIDLEAGPDFEICEGESIDVNANASVNDFSWTGPDSNIPNQLTFNYQPSASGTYYLQADNACKTVIDSFTVTIGESPMVEAGEEILIETGETAELVGQATGDYYWSSTAIIDDPLSLSTSVMPTANTWYYLNSSINDCEASDSVRVRVETIVWALVASGFSPDNDGRNDEARIQLTYGIKEINSFMIFNRYGQKVYDGTGFDAAWNGVFNSEPQPIGVYTYLMEATTNGDLPFEQHGDITLIR